MVQLYIVMSSVEEAMWREHVVQSVNTSSQSWQL